MKRKLRGYEFEEQLKRALEEGTDKSITKNNKGSKKGCNNWNLKVQKI